MHKILIKAFAAFSLLFTVQISFAAIDVHEFKNETNRQRYQSFIDEMRCPKCQNQNLSGSDSPIAMDLRNELYLMIEAGKSDQEIVSFMVERYGEFILYRPRLSPATLLLWATPVLLLVFGALLLLLIVRKRRRIAEEADAGLSQQERARLDALLNDKSVHSSDKNKQEKNK
ncbi:cytochrome c-type biogenesis protein [Cellvibrio mixtus]|uniref:cytochrome c-type biogenesis protein n=1 Tax=Cellvibrio mixtus TaxID=39650 RepID=UPI000587AD71|nr:cytochrome c-type biogenesis protein [Cellvibrio mixtus]